MCKVFSTGCLVPFPGYFYHSGAILPPVPCLVLHSQGYRSAENPQVGREDMLLRLAKRGICPESLWVKQVEGKD